MNFTAREALQIAASYGFSIRAGKWERSLIRDSIIQAREAEGPRPGGNFRSARSYFDGYMADTASEIHCDGMAARDFERNAYGY